MGQGITDWGATVFVAAMFGLGSPPSGFWLGLLSDEAGEAMDGTMTAELEPPPTVTDPDDDTVTLATGYARQAIGMGPGTWAMDSATVTNLLDIAFPLAAADWGRVDHWALLNDNNEGELYCWAELPEPAYIAADWQLVIPAGGLVIALASLDDTYNPD